MKLHVECMYKLDVSVVITLCCPFSFLIRSLQSMKTMTIPPSTHHFVDVLFGQAQPGTPDVKLEMKMKQLDANLGDEIEVCCVTP